MDSTTEKRKRPLAITLGITGDMAFAAGCVLQGIRKYSPDLDADILIYTDGALPEADAELLRSLGADLLPYTPPVIDFDPESVRMYSPLTLSKLDCLLLLDRYERVVWLDADIAVQGDIRELAEYGPFGMALEDPAFMGNEEPSPVSINVREPLPGLDSEAPNLNGGILVLHDSLPGPAKLHRMCMRWLAEHASKIIYMEQPALNMLAQMLRKRDPTLFREVPYDRFNAHPYNPSAQRAVIVHAFGAAKMWNDGLVNCAFPEWERDYRRWLALGGSAWQGAMRNAEFMGHGAMFLLCSYHFTADRLEKEVRALRAELEG